MQTSLLGPDDLPDLVAFLTADEWPFHAGGRPTPAQVRERAGRGAYWGQDVESHWLLADTGPVGLVRLDDLTDDTAMVDLRVLASARGRGVATAAIGWLTGHVFSSRACTRIEAQTRHDNTAMRRVLLRCGWVKEAHHRASWPTVSGEPVDGVAYAVLRQDWVTGTVTPVHWDDEPW